MQNSSARRTVSRAEWLSLQAGTVVVTTTFTHRSDTTGRNGSKDNDIERRTTGRNGSNDNDIELRTVSRAEWFSTQNSPARNVRLRLSVSQWAKVDWQ